MFVQAPDPVVYTLLISTPLKNLKREQRRVLQSLVPIKKAVNIICRFVEFYFLFSVNNY